MKDIVFVVKSHQRVDRFRQKTYDKIILHYGFPLDKVYVFVSTSEDLNLYRDAYPQIHIVKAPRGIVRVDNFITGYFNNGQKIVYMNDDVTSIQKIKKDGTFAKLSKNDLWKLIHNSFDMMVEYDISYGGLYPVRNNLFMANLKTITFDFVLIMDPFSFVINDRSIKISIGDKSDFEKSILHFKKRGALLRHNCITLNAEYYGEKGGFQGRDDKSELATAEAMKRKYPDYIAGINVKKHGRTSLRFKRIPAWKTRLPKITSTCPYKT